MTLNFKKIYIGKLLQSAVNERNINEKRICDFLHCDPLELEQMFQSQSLDTELLLRWSKLLEYDFFRLYSQHLILYSPQMRVGPKKRVYDKLPAFRKNIYTHEMIQFFLELIEKNEKTIHQIVEEYGIPKTTIYRWRNKQPSSEKK